MTSESLTKARSLSKLNFNLPSAIQSQHNFTVLWIWVWTFQNKSRGRNTWKQFHLGIRKKKKPENTNYLCGDHDDLQNLQPQLPRNLVSGSVFFTRVHEVKLQVFPQTLFFHLRIKMSHCISATEDQFLNKQNILFIRKFLRDGAPGWHSG